jgi:hypothetical protein
MSNTVRRTAQKLWLVTGELSVADLFDQRRTTLAGGTVRVLNESSLFQLIRPLELWGYSPLF